MSFFFVIGRSVRFVCIRLALRVNVCACACYEGLKWRAGKALKDTGPQSLVLVIRRERNAGMYLCLSVAH